MPVSGAKQDPTEKKKRALAADGKCYFSYAQIAAAVSRAVPEVEAFAPDVFVAIGGGGLIPARMLRTEVKKPILAISLELYDDATKTANATVLRKQWFDETPGTFGALVRGKRVLIVDEVDDTRKWPLDLWSSMNNPTCAFESGPRRRHAAVRGRRAAKDERAGRDRSPRRAQQAEAEEGYAAA